MTTEIIFSLKNNKTISKQVPFFYNKITNFVNLKDFLKFLEGEIVNSTIQSIKIKNLPMEDSKINAVLLAKFLKRFSNIKFYIQDIKKFHKIYDTLNTLKNQKQILDILNLYEFSKYELDFLNLYKKNKKIALIDSHNFYHRLYHGFKEDLDKVEESFLNYIKILKENYDDVYVFSDHTKSFRKNFFVDYKKNREKREKLEKWIQNFEKRHNIIKVEGFEADDLITSTIKFLKYKEAIIHSTDKDLLANVNENTKVYNPVTKQLYNEKNIIEKFGIQPSQFIDYLSLIGDKADNIEGVKGIGPKKAISLLKNNKNIITILRKENPNKIEQSVINSKEKVLLAKMLIKPLITTNIELIAF